MTVGQRSMDDLSSLIKMGANRERTQSSSADGKNGMKRGFPPKHNILEAHDGQATE